MKPVPRRTAIPVAIDPLDASGGFGALSGVLSVVLPYFDGLTMALAAVVVGTALLRWMRGSGPGEPQRPDARRFLLGLVSALAGWGIFLVAPAGIGWVRGLVLGTAVLPLWWLERRPPAFGEG